MAVGWSTAVMPMLCRHGFQDVPRGCIAGMNGHVPVGEVSARVRTTRSAVERLQVRGSIGMQRLA
jgi:hypothetical protein